MLYTALKDILISNNHGPAVLYRNDTPHGNNWISLKLQGTASNSSALGAVVRVGPQSQLVVTQPRKYPA